MTALLLLALTAAPGTLERAAGLVATQVVDRHFTAPIALYVEGAPLPLQRALASVIAARLSEQGLTSLVVDAKDATLAEVAAHERGAVSVLRLTASVEGTKLSLRGDVITSRGDAGVRVNPVAIIAHVLETDAEVVTLAGPQAQGAPLELKLTSLTRLTEVPAALAVADLDGDRRAEVLVLTQDHLEVHAGHDGHLLARAELTQPLSVHPTREPFGAIWTSGNRVTVWSSRREHAETFSFKAGTLKPVGPAELVVDGLSLHAEPGIAGFARELTWVGKPVTLPTLASSLSTFGAMALFTFNDGSAALARGLATTGKVTGVGSGSCLADLDADGTPELVVTSARTVGEVDEVRVLALEKFEALQSRSAPLAEATPTWQQALKGRALVAASGDLDADATDEVVLGLWQSDGSGELVVLKRVTP